MKLIFVNRFFYPDLSATAQLLSDLAFGLAAEGAEVHVITSRLRYDEPGARLPALETVGGVVVHRVWTTRFGRRSLPGRSLDYLSFYLTAGLGLWRLAAPGDVAVVKTDPPLFSVVALPILKRRRAHLVNWLQDLFPEIAVREGLLSGSGLLARSLLKMRNRTLEGARLNIAISEGMKSHLLAQGIEARSVEVVHNWADGAVVHPVPADENELRRAWGLEGTFVVGHSGNLGRIHDVGTVANAIEREGGTSGVAFLFVGGGRGYVALEDLAKGRGCENVHFRPYEPRDRLHLSLSLPDVHLVSLAPEMEGLAFASKLYGVFAAGRAVIFIGARDSEAARILEEAQCGLAVEAGKSEQLVEAIRLLKDDPDICRDMGRRARALFERAYDKDIAIARWRRALLSGCGAKGPHVGPSDD